MSSFHSSSTARDFAVSTKTSARPLHDNGEHSGPDPPLKVATSKPSSVCAAGGSTSLGREASGANGTQRAASSSYCASYAS